MTKTARAGHQTSISKSVDSLNTEFDIPFFEMFQDFRFHSNFMHSSCRCFFFRNLTLDENHTTILKVEDISSCYNVTVALKKNVVQSCKKDNSFNELGLPPVLVL